MRLLGSSSLSKDGRNAGIDAAGSVYVRGVSKAFRKHTVAKQSYSTVKSTLVERFLRGEPKTANRIQALKELTVEVPAGSALGVIGRNGSGKSTLLKLIAGIYRPDSGEVRVNGRVSALIELGAGFHPDFTGRENVYLGGTMYGLSRREIDERFDDIVGFAELEDFIDDPVRTYSSGMYMRLGFSLAIHTDPDILLVDEVLAVGDASFIHRCHERISEMRRKGKTLIFVTHDLASVVRWCDEAVWLERGVVKRRGDPQWVIDSYLQDVDEDSKKQLERENVERESAGASEPEAQETAPDLKRWGNKDVEITAVRMFGKNAEEKWLFQSGEPVTIEVAYSVNKPVDDLIFGVGILRADGLVVHGTNTAIDRCKAPIPVEGASLPRTGLYRFGVDRLSLVEDTYFLDVAAHRSDGTPYDYHHLLHQFSVRSMLKHQGVFNPEHVWEFAPSYEAKDASKP